MMKNLFPTNDIRLEKENLLVRTLSEEFCEISQVPKRHGNLRRHKKLIMSRKYLHGRPEQRKIFTHRKFPKKKGLVKHAPHKIIVCGQQRETIDLMRAIKICLTTGSVDPMDLSPLSGSTLDQLL